MSKRALLDKHYFLWYNIHIPCFIFIVAFQFFGVFVFNKRLKFIIITPLLDNKNVKCKLCNISLFEGAYLVSLMEVTLSGGYLVLENLNSLNLSTFHLCFSMNVRHSTSNLCESASVRLLFYSFSVNFLQIASFKSDCMVLAKTDVDKPEFASVLSAIRVKMLKHRVFFLNSTFLVQYRSSAMTCIRVIAIMTCIDISLDYLFNLGLYYVEKKARFN